MPRGGRLSYSSKWLFVGTCFEFSLVGVAALLAAILGRDLRADLQWNIRALTWLLPATIPLIVLFWGILGSAPGPWAEIRKSLEQMLGPIVIKAPVGWLFALSMAAGVGEELLFRAVLQGAMTEQWGLLPALVISSALFGVCHFVTRFYAYVAAAMGLYFGVLWIQSGTLWLPILVHALYDFCALLLFRSRLRAQSQAPYGPVGL